ncbi:voltage-dependent calcium channel subunit alpha-2/delta-2-like isoform X2 [Dreissena polymorpha]|uniref:voltage-dependent calcium channel subunit alpha-2/delta-2-like isoform X2 n=1 Tax=Dreissena polymorpha TaxID=45954 RepID=UPI0022645FC1|nr:voltage-dependent calcium channel subunit alpha-2/delta-2-like isoform X2 [Dreissena polymorpha]
MVTMTWLLGYLLTIVTSCKGGRFPGEEKYEVGTLEGDVQNWAVLIENYILQLAYDGINQHYTQGFLDKAMYQPHTKKGEDIVRIVKDNLADYFEQKKLAAERLVKQVQLLHDQFLESNASAMVDKLSHLPQDVYADTDIPERLPPERKFYPYFKQQVSWEQSAVKIADEVPRDDISTINSVFFTAKLDELFKENQKIDPTLRWQYFGSTTGMVRLYPGREWSTNFAGFYNDYDPRVRPWYIAATSGPKDVIIILDCSDSMKGEKFSIAKGVAKTVINTLTKQDYVNVICARASYWDEVGKWHFYQTTVLSCQQERMVPATIAHRKDLIRNIKDLKPGGTSELESGFGRAFDLLRSNPRTGCQSVIVFATDGMDTDGENVRCGPGYYTRSGYVPGPVCRYNWTKVWSIADHKNSYYQPQTRVFSYLIKEDAEKFPGKLACSHGGSLLKLVTGENLISQMSNYFEFLSSNARTTKALWTSPYLDAWGLGIMVTYAIPVISGITGRTIGVVGIDATLDKIENFLTKHQWGTVYSFLINNQGETIFHPKLKPSTNLLEDPIFIPIQQLEQNKKTLPEEFSLIEEAMRQGKEGSMRIERSIDGKPRTYYYAGLNNSEYSFAYVIADTDMEFLRSQEPSDRSSYKTSYFNLLKHYNSSQAKEKLPSGTLEIIDIKENEPKYPGLRISYKYSTIFLAPMSYCDPIEYIYDDDLDMKTVDAHLWINSDEPDLGCETGNQKFEKGVRADVLITQPIEEIWKARKFESLSQIKWTNVGLRSGVFRTYPGHRSRRTYDPTKRPWYRTTSAQPHQISISTPYMDAAGVGKIVTISQAVFEGMKVKSESECFNFSRTGPWPGGCMCNLDVDCIIKVCYLSMNEEAGDHRRCASERVEAVTGLDILYDDFQNKTMDSMEASDFKKSCGLKYDCPDGEPGCLTRCYLFDSNAFLIMDPDFQTAKDIEERKYEKVQLGEKEGEVMKDLVYKHTFIRRTERVDFQGSCRITKEEPKVTLEGIAKNPEEQDDYIRNKGPIPKFNSEFGCIQDVVGYTVNESALGPSGMVTGNVSGPCMSGFYYVTTLPKTNLYLLVIENWKHNRASLFYNFNCAITRSVVNSGAYRIINGTCDHMESSTVTLAGQNKCPSLRDLKLPCRFTTGTTHTASLGMIGITLLLSYVLSAT